MMVADQPCPWGGVVRAEHTHTIESEGRHTHKKQNTRPTEGGCETSHRPAVEAGSLLKRYYKLYLHPL